MSNPWDRYVQPGWPPTAEDLVLIGVAVTKTTRIERWAREIAVVPITAMTLNRFPWQELLLGSRGTREAQRWLTQTTTWSIPQPDWLPDALGWMKKAEKAIDERDGLIHRGHAITTQLSTDSSETWSSQPTLIRSRRGNSSEPAAGQLQELVDRLVELDKDGSALFGRALEWQEARFIDAFGRPEDM